MDKIVDRIRKLLALATSPNAAEAASALAHAQRLMAEHQLSQHDLDVAEIEMHGCDDSAMSRARRPPVWEIMLANTVAEAFGVLSVRKNGTGTRICFYGPGARAEVAAYCFVVLLRKLTAARLEYMAAGFAIGRIAALVSAGDAFAEGWVRAVYQVVVRIFMTENESRAVQLWAERNLGDLVSVRGRSAGDPGVGNARADGWRQGSEVELYRSMATGERSRQLTGRCR